MCLGMLLVVISCEQNPMVESARSSLADHSMEGQQYDEINWLPWNENLQSQIQVYPDTAVTELERAGSDFQYVTAAGGGVVGGADTYGNSVYIPPNAVTQDTYIGIMSACSDADAFFSDVSALIYIDDAIEELESLSVQLAGNVYADSNISTALDGLLKVRAYFAVYATHSDVTSFDLVINNVLNSVQQLAYNVTFGLIDESYFDAISSVSESVLLAAQTMAVSTLARLKQFARYKKLSYCF